MNIGLILLSGKGSRLNQSTPKQYLEINAKPLFSYSVASFNATPSVDKILLVADSDHIDYVKDKVKEYGFDKVMDVISGGDTRIESTYNGLKYLKDNNIDNNDIVLIHDAARPLVSSSLITNLIKECEEVGAVTPSIKIKDTVIMGDNIVRGYANREELFINQTPQTFKFKLIYDAHTLINKNKVYTDDVSIAIDSGVKVKIIPGEEFNFKVTTKADFEILKSYLK